MAVGRDDIWRMRWNAIVDSVEHVSFGLYCQGTSGTASKPNEDDRNYQSLMDDMTDWWDAMNTAELLGNSYLESVQLQQYGYNSASGWATFAQTVYTSSQHVSAINRCPYQISTVVTLMTTEDVPGPRQRAYNRAYIGPMALTDVGADGKLTVAARSALLTTVEDFNDAVIANVAVVTNITSKGLMVFSPTNAEAYSTVEAKVGNVYDTQRRRRNEIAEAYSASSLPDS